MLPWLPKSSKGAQLDLTYSLAAAIVVAAALTYLMTALVGLGDLKKQERLSLMPIFSPSTQAQKEETIEEQEPPKVTEMTASSMATPEVTIPFSIPTMGSITIPDIPMGKAPAPERLQLSALTDIKGPEVSKAGVKANFALAKPISRVAPQYPLRARQLGIEGSVEMLLLIGTDGRVKEVKVINETPKGYFAQSATRTIRRWSFVAPEKESWQRLKIKYDLENGG